MSTDNSLDLAIDGAGFSARCLMEEWVIQEREFFQEMQKGYLPLQVVM